MDTGIADNEVARPEPRHWGFWGTTIFGIITGLIFILASTVTYVVIILSRHKYHIARSEFDQVLKSSINDGYCLSVATFITAVLCGGLVLCFIKFKRGSVLKDYLGIMPVTPRVFLKWMGILAIYLALSESLSIVLKRPPSEFMVGGYTTAEPKWMFWLAVVFVGPLFEELFFRGFLLKGYESSFLKPIGAVVLTATLWAAIHLQYDAYEIATLFCLGLLLGIARVSTRSVLVPLGMHTVNNLIAVVMLVAL